MATQINLHPQTTKRQKIAISSLVFSVMISVLLLGGAGWLGIVILTALSYGAVVYSLDFDLRREEWLAYPLLPILASISFYTWISQYANNEVSWIISATILAGLGMYGLLLTLNILNIATVRVLPLERTAKTVLSLAGVVVAFSVYQLIAIGQPSHSNWVMSIGGVSLLIAWPLIWTSMSGKRQFLRSVAWAGLVSLILMQLAIVAGWWPISHMTSLFLSMSLFIAAGIIHLQEQKTVSAAEKKQYLFLAVLLAVGLYISSQW